MSFPRYPKYKDSGVEWLGEVPDSWDVRPFWTLYVRSKRAGFPEEQLLSVYREYGVVRKSDRDDNHNNPSEDLATYQLVEVSDLVINKMKAWQGSVAVSPFRGIVSPAYFVYRPIHSMSSRFLHYLMRSIRYITGYLSLSKGVRIGQWDLDPVYHSVMPVLVPSNEEQQVIADFLDRETAKIDALIEEQRRLNELLKEKRQAVISYTLTKGLNLAAQMKDSGIQGGGLVPAHWQLSRLKHASHFRTSGPRGWSDRIAEAGVLFVQSGDLDDAMRIRYSSCQRVDIQDDAEAVRTRLREGDVVVCITGAKTGNVAVAQDLPERAHMNQHICLVRPNERVLPGFLGHLLKSDLGQDYFNQSQYGMKQGLSLDNVANVPVLLPPLTEQKEILRKVESALERLAGMEQAASVAIALLQERRSALISAAVTGKIDVRQPIRKPVASVKPYTSGFAHQLLAAKILSRCNDSHMGRVKLQKLIHVAEYHAEIEELRGDYTRKMAGPLDMKAIKGLEAGLERLGWFRTIEETNPKRYRYVPLDRHEQHGKYLERWTDKQARIDEVLTLMGGMTMRQCEIVSTLYAAWNDLLIDNHPATEDAILAQATTAEGWHASKEKTPRESWIKALRWMKEKGLVPTGFGTHTRKAKAEDVHEPA